MADQEKNSKKEPLREIVPKGAKKQRAKSGLSWRDIFLQIVVPNKWTLKARFLYFTGTLLALGSVFQIFFLAYTLDNTINNRALERLQLLESQLRSELDIKKQFLLGQAVALAAIPEVKEALLAQDRDKLKIFSKPYIEAVRQATGLAALEFYFYLAPGTTFFDSSTLPVIGEDVSANPVMQRVHQTHLSLATLDVAAKGPLLRALAPALVKDAVIGAVAVSLPLNQAVTSALPKDCAATPLISRDFAKNLDKGLPLKPIGNWLMFLPDDKAAADLAISAFADDRPKGRVADVYFAIAQLQDLQGKDIAALHISYDPSLLHEIKRNRVYQLGGLFLSGAITLWLFLWFNVSRIERFFNRLKKIIIASHSNDFSERFESDHIHCLDVMHCHNEDCPVFIDPTRVCYLETGSEAISPKWRDTCIFLNKYERCGNCPVYLKRKGDELAEMRNVVNTMMRLWSRFLSRTGHLLAYVLRSQEQTGQLPSLDQVSNRLEEMAKITFFSHDVQGTLDKDEVYKQLAHVFAKHFGITRFTLFEVDHDSRRILIALDKTLSEPLCKKNVLLSTDICRANRVAEDVISFYNPMLCPYFNCDLDADVRCCLPMVMGGHVGAIFSFIAPRSEWESIRGQKLPLMRKYLDEAAPVLSSLRLLKLSKEQALRDPLTHCHNRRFLDEFMSKYEPLSEREGKKTGFLMADVDYFKQVNDEHGHEAGDAVLQQIVGILHSCIRRSDLLIRYGGEEFLMLLQDVQEGTSEMIAEKIRSSVDAHKFELPGGAKLHKTISLGVAEYPQDGNALYKAIKFSDVALYAAKNAGRNRVMRFTADMWTGDAY